MQFSLRSCTAVVLLFTATACPAQVFIKKGDGKNEMKIEGQPFNLGELGAVILQEEGKVKVVHAMDPGRRPEGYANVDVKIDDIIIMANAKKIQSTMDLQTIYDGLAVGTELKLGIKRGEQMLIASFPKADPAKLPKVKMRIMTAGDGGDVQAFPAVGVVLSESKTKSVVIVDKFPDSTTAVGQADVKVNDHIVELNGKHISTLKQYTDMYDGLAVGSRVAWKLRRKDETIIVNFLKPQPRGGMIRREIKK